ncbi:hypothetical protein A4G20_07450 [Pasteurellaceae bacterium RH1A]|nr:hypothetical protein A4G20_07450 [Pasteurellaceae bacterium RH1A]
MSKVSLFAGFALFLTACSSNPASYLPAGSKPLVNVEADLAPQLEVKACPEKLAVTNISNQALALSYKLFWYDLDGVTQGHSSPWQSLWLEAQQTQSLALDKPTAESAKYRFYARSPK